MSRRSSSTLRMERGAGAAEEGRGARWKSRSASWLQLLALAAVLQAAAAAPTTAAEAAAAAGLQKLNLLPPRNPNLGAEIEIPSSADSEEEEEKATSLLEDKNATEVNFVTAHAREIFDRRQVTENGLQLGLERIVTKRSGKTIDEFRGFVEKTCRDADNFDTFLSWEQDQFSLHLKNSMLSPVYAGSGPRGSGGRRVRTTGEERERVRRATLSASALATDLQSLCRLPTEPIDWKADDRTKNDKFENRVVDEVFNVMIRPPTLTAKGFHFTRQAFHFRHGYFEPKVLPRATTGRTESAAARDKREMEEELLGDAIRRALK